MPHAWLQDIDKNSLLQIQFVSQTFGLDNPGNWRFQLVRCEPDPHAKAGGIGMQFVELTT